MKAPAPKPGTLNKHNEDHTLLGGTCEERARKLKDGSEWKTKRSALSGALTCYLLCHPVRKVMAHYLWNASRVFLSH